MVNCKRKSPALFTSKRVRDRTPVTLMFLLETLILEGGTVARQIVVNNGVFEMYSGGTTTNLELTSSRLITHRTANFNEVTLRTGNYTLTQAINARKLTIDGGTTTLSATSTIDQLNITAGSLILEARLDAGTNLNASGNSIVQMRTAQELNGLVINNRATVQIENSAANNPFGTLASVCRLAMARFVRTSIRRW